MVQVDVFWSYGIGAGLALAASRQLAAAPASGGGGGASTAEDYAPFNNRFFMTALVYLSVFFAPSGVYLLWAFTSWETMHVWDKTLHPLVVTAFAVTNVTQGIIGFRVTCGLARAGRLYPAFLQMVAGYFFMFFILVHGWDGTGYRRFFSATRGDFLGWEVSNVPEWFLSPVAVSLYVMGAVIIPVLLYYTAKWIKEGYALAAGGGDLKGGEAGYAEIMALFLCVVFVCALGAAIAASLAIHWMGWVPGAAAALIAMYLVCLRRGGLFHWFYRRLMRAD